MSDSITIADTFSVEEVSNRCAALPEGALIKVSFYEGLEHTSIKVIRGALCRLAPSAWVVMHPNGSSIRLPSESINVIGIDSQPTDQGTNDSEQQPRPQPKPDQLIDLFRSQLEAQQRFFQQQSETQMRSFEAQLSKTQESHQRALNELKRAPLEEVPPPPTDDVERLMRFGDAIRGQDNPQWRLCAGLLLPNAMPQRFVIFSIPHLLFRADPFSGRMTRLAKGTAVAAYIAMRADCRMQFPNQIVVRSAPRTDKGSNAKGPATTVDSSSGTRAQLERAERMFADLLGRLDLLDAKDLPTTKAEWMIFLDAGVAVLELYASLANGFVKGGSKVALAYDLAITTTGRFDPSKLWPTDSRVEGDSFRY